MWKSCDKSSSPTLHSPSIFRCSSFKDIESLFLEPQDLHTHNQNQLHQKPSVFHRVRFASSILAQWPGRPEPKEPRLESIRISSWENRIVVYYTSLCVIRPTFEACRSIVSLLQAFQVPIDERDLSKDPTFMVELQSILGIKEQNKMTLPVVFIGGKYVGGAEEVKHLHEMGELKKLVEGFPVAGRGGCSECGGFRFVVCAKCDGSHKVYDDKVGFRYCVGCNQNGLVRCSSCSCPPFRVHDVKNFRCEPS